MLYTYIIHYVYIYICMYMRMNISEHTICDPPTQVKVRHRRLVAVSQPQAVDALVKFEDPLGTTEVNN